jgi:pSer/pThr/pTyr-binding forkhead associated (FHA) protein
MILKYLKPNGTLVEMVLQDKPITIGRSPKADIILDDEKASRLHCGIRFLDGEYTLKDLASKNGTYLNEERCESETLKVGDKIRVGSTVITVEQAPSKGATTAFQEMQQEMSEGKGYDTILKEIVGKPKKSRSS